MRCASANQIAAPPAPSVGRYQPLERHTPRQNGQDMPAISHFLLRRSHGRLEIGHDDGVRKVPRRVGEVQRPEFHHRAGADASRRGVQRSVESRIAPICQVQPGEVLEHL